MSLNFKLLLFLFLLLSVNVKAQNVADSLLKLLDEPQSDTLLIDRYYKIADYYNKTDNHSSLLYAEKGLTLAEKINDSLRIAIGNLKSGVALSTLSFYNLAIDKYTKSQEYGIKLNQEYILSLTYNNIGNIYWFQKKYSLARQYYHKALQLAKNNKNQRFITGLYLNLGLVSSSDATADSSQFYFITALQLAKQLNDSSLIGLILNNLSEDYYKNGQFSDMEKCLTRIKKYEQTLPTHVKASVYSNWAFWYIIKKQPKKAYQYLETAHEIALESQSLYALQSYYEDRFQIDTLLHDYVAAIKTQSELMAVKDSISNIEFDIKMNNFQSLLDLKEKENEIKILKSSNEIYHLKNQQNNLYIGILSIIALSAVIIIVLIIRSVKLKNQSINSLHQMNIELKANKEELLALNEELSMNQEELFENNKNLEHALLQLKNTQNHLIQSEKMASIGVLSRGVAHELINPLNFINGGIAMVEEMYQENTQSTSTLEIPLQMMNEGITRAVNIVRQLSAFVDQGNTKPQMSNMNQIIESTLVFLNYRIDLETKLIKEFSELPDGYFYPDKIHSITFQLLTNAIDAVKKVKGEKIIKLCTRISKLENSQAVEFKVYNSGNPIDADVLPKIFDPFFTTKDANKGTGMGLTLVYNLVNEQKGNISVQNLETGVLFTVLLPFMEFDKTN